MGRGRRRRRRRSQENSKKKQQAAAPPPPTPSLSAAAPAVITTREPRQSSSRKSYYIRSTRDLAVLPAAKSSSKQRHLIMTGTKSPNTATNAPLSINPGSPEETEFRADSVLSTNHQRVSVKPQPSETAGFPPELALRRIITKVGDVEPKKRRSGEEKSSSSLIIPRRRSSSSVSSATMMSSAGVKLRVNSPKLGSRRVMMMQRKMSWRRSRAVVKSSVDPKKDFRESMVEMIKANNIRRGSKDMEELLACYLTLNSEEYHSLIINVFNQIWF